MMGNANTEMTISRKESKGNARHKNSNRNEENVFVGVISRLDVAKERISDLEDRSIETSQVEMQRKK